MDPLAEQFAVEYARISGARDLSPVVLDSGKTMTEEIAATERQIIVEVLCDGIRQRTHPSALARTLYKRMKCEGVLRDWDRLARTELARALHHGAWRAQREAGGWRPDTMVYRMPSVGACNVCLRLHITADGFPRLYPVAEVEGHDAFGLNRGARRGWHLRIGPIHPNCSCPPFARWNEILRSLFERSADERWRRIMRERGLNTGKAGG